MELQKQGHHVFEWEDVKIKVRAHATAGDRFELNMLYDVDTKGRVEVPRRRFYVTVIERFVESWEGVNEDGKPVPFSIANLERLPVKGTDDVILLLGAFIINRCGILPGKEGAERKNG